MSYQRRRREGRGKEKRRGVKIKNNDLLGPFLYHKIVIEQHFIAKVHTSRY